MRKKIIVLFFALLALITLSIIAVSAETEEFTAEDSASLESAKAELDLINKKQAQLSSELSQYSSQKNSEVKAKQVIEQQLVETDKKISTLEWIIDTLENRLTEKNSELEIAQKEYEEYYEKYIARIRENYELGTTTYLEVILTSENFSDMLTRYDYIRDMMDYDKKLLETMVNNIAFIASLREEIITDKADQLTALEQLSTEKSMQTAKAEDLESSISYISKNIAQLQAEQKEFARLEEELEKEINNLLDKKKKYAGGTFIWPLDSKWSRISSGYGPRTLYGVKEYHYAIDIPADKGSPIYAAADGTIIYYGWTNTGGGNKVVIDHGSKLSTHYNHMSAYVPELQAEFKANGKVDVKKGDVIGYVGTTGNSTGNHLDFKILVDGNPVDPSLYVTPDGSTPKNDIMELLY